MTRAVNPVYCILYSPRNPQVFCVDKSLTYECGKLVNTKFYHVEMYK